MEIKKYSYFWEALIITVFVFALGIFLGFLIEQNRTEKIVSLFQQSEIDLLDIRIQDGLLDIKKIDCENILKEVIDFADRTYQSALLLQRYEDANQISKSIVIQHKKYDLLRTILWLDSIKIKEKCNFSLNTVVYFYEYNSNRLDLKSKQDTFSKRLTEVKYEYAEKIMLIPIAGNLEITSINFLKNSYNVTFLPSILINEKFKIEEIEDLDKIEGYLNK